MKASRRWKMRRMSEVLGTTPADLDVSWAAKGVADTVDLMLASEAGVFVLTMTRDESRRVADRLSRLAKEEAP